MLDPKTLKKNILQDLRVELTDEFDRNFERKTFFGNRWKPRRIEGRGSLLLVTGFRSIQLTLHLDCKEFGRALRNSQIKHKPFEFLACKVIIFLFECKFTKNQRKLLPLGVEMNPTANMDKVCLAIR